MLDNRSSLISSQQYFQQVSQQILKKMTNKLQTNYRIKYHTNYRIKQGISHQSNIKQQNLQQEVKQNQSNVLILNNHHYQNMEIYFSYVQKQKQKNIFLILQDKVSYYPQQNYIIMIIIRDVQLRYILEKGKRQQQRC
ncbi:unnamed protein product [Paramecium sonneborni]|uniref:Uncharacterized protein n=1 Tax=Paramecium sonneborni TaxID=65129 RepID=A0A8S1NKZ6_9CILI|nr:unnamed protein product [Paramecium sonneborni]